MIDHFSPRRVLESWAVITIGRFNDFLFIPFSFEGFCTTIVYPLEQTSFEYDLTFVGV